MASISAAVQSTSFRAASGELVSSALTGSNCRVSVSAPDGPFLVRPLAKRVCDLTGKKANNGYRVSFSNHRTKHLQGVNLQYKRLWWEEAKKFVKMRVSTNALKTIDKKGLSQLAKEAGIDLNDFVV